MEIRLQHAGACPRSSTRYARQRRLKMPASTRRVLPEVFDSLCQAATVKMLASTRKSLPEVWAVDAAKVPDVNAQGLSHTLYAMAALGWILPEVFRLAELHRGSEGAGRQRAGFPPHALCCGCARQVSLEGINWVSYADAAMVQDVNAQSLAHTMCAMAALGACARRFRFEVLHRCREGARRQRAGPLPHAVRYGCVRQGPA